MQILAQSGLHFTSLRIGQISGGLPNGAWATTDWVPILVKSSLELGALPSATGLASWLPMHAVARTLLDVALSTETGTQPALNIVHPRPVAWDFIISAVNDALVKEGVVKGRLPVVEFSKWFELLETKSVEDSSAKRISDIVCSRNICLIKLTNNSCSLLSSCSSFSAGLPKWIGLLLASKERTMGK